MNQQLTSLGGAMDSLKWVAVISLIGFGVFGNQYFSDHSLLVRVAGLVMLGLMATGVALQTDKGRRFWQFAVESRNELRKVVWPNRQETVQTTVLVLGVIAIVGLILWGVDILLLRVIAWLTGYGAS